VSFSCIVYVSGSVVRLFSLITANPLTFCLIEDSHLLFVFDDVLKLIQNYVIVG